MEHLDDLLAGSTVVLDNEVLDRIDKIAARSGAAIHGTFRA
jgi:hypothetical protein